MLVAMIVAFAGSLLTPAARTIPTSLTAQIDLAELGQAHAEQEPRQPHLACHFAADGKTPTRTERLENGERLRAGERAER